MRLDDLIWFSVQRGHDAYRVLNRPFAGQSREQHEEVNAHLLPSVSTLCREVCRA